MGPRAFRLLMALAIFCAMASAVRAQVFVVGEKTAMADVVTEFHATHVALPTALLDERGQQELIRGLEAEQGFAHRELPLGTGLTLVANGNMSPRDDEYKQLLYRKGQSAAAGDRVAITALAFHANSLVIDLNGGPYAKHRFISHVSINDVPLAQPGATATGCRITLTFEGGVPELSAEQVKALLDPLIDFKARSSEEAYADTLPPLVRRAVEAHEILVGMNRRMVLAAVGMPRAKHREHAAGTSAADAMYEEWIYGEPPQPTQFVRFEQGRVVRLEIAELGKPVVVRDRNELGGEAAPTLQTRTIMNGDQDASTERTTPPPTLRRPGEKTEIPSSVGRVPMPADTPSTNPASDPPKQWSRPAAP